MSFTEGDVPPAVDPVADPRPRRRPTPDRRPGREDRRRRGRENDSAFAALHRWLDQFGLGNLADKVWGWHKEGRPVDQIMLDVRDTREYKARFPAMAEMSKQGRAISEAEYISYERTTIQLMRSAGLPGGFYDKPEDFAKLLVNGVSPAELQSRIEDGWVRVARTDPNIRNAFAQFYGADSDSALAAFFLDPDAALPVLEKAAAAAEVGGTGFRYGLNLNRGRAEELAGLGLDAASSAQGFGELAGLRDVFAESVSEQDDLTAEEEGIDLAFGTGVPGAERVRRRVGERKSVFEGGGGALTTNEGFTGAGSNRSRGR